MIEPSLNPSCTPIPHTPTTPARPNACDGRRPASHLATVLIALVFVAHASAALAQGGGSGYTLIGWNDLGMHCMDADYSVFSILPPYNVIHAQLIDPSGNLVTNPGGITVTYEAMADPDGSINASSIGKTNFWDWVASLFGSPLAPDEGLAGSDMPGPINTPQPMHFDTGLHWFSGEGIPITPWDDDGGKNYYPVMRLVARDASGSVLATTRIVLPVSDEMSCSSCHGSDSTSTAAMPTGGWITDPDPEREYRLNILLIHDQLQDGSTQYANALAAAGYNASGLYATVTSDGTSILCDACHGSNALPGTGQAGISPLTEAVHSLHAGVVDPANGMTLNASKNRTACYTCHPGSDTRCLRGAMGAAVAANGDLAMQCQSCHGRMTRVGTAGRAGWFDQPTCQNCHSGTATNNNGRIRYVKAFDESGEPRVAVDSTFATDPNTPVAGVSLYRFSTGHGGLQCEACHGSTHAIYPSSHLNDNLQSIDQQGHAGTLVDCAGCHGTSPRTTTGGPHGMHPIGQVWVSEHHDAAEHNTGQCRTCHGTDYRGTVLSRAQGDRTLSAFGTKNFWRGFQIGCYTCHRGPNEEDRNNNRAPVVNNVTASTDEDVPVEIALSASDADGDNLSLRIVSQPANGTVGLVGTVATFYPFAGFSGSDGFTYAAWDGSTNSNLGTGTVTVAGTGGSTCTVDCSATVDMSGEVGSPASFFGDAVLSDCVGGAIYEWDFGDGSGAAGADTSHTYGAPGSYDWSLVVTADGASCTRTGTIEIAPADSQCSLSCRAEVTIRSWVGKNVEFHGSSESSNCGGSVAYEWDFGDGSSVVRGQEVGHTYSTLGTFNWRLRVLRDGAVCETTGTIAITNNSTRRSGERHAS